MIVIGVSDKGEVHGVDIGKKTIESLANKIKQSTDPMVYPSIRVEESDKKQVVAIEVEEGKQKPVLAFGRGFMRVGKEVGTKIRRDRRWKIRLGSRGTGV